MKKYKELKETLLQKIELPALEDILYFVLILFSIIFGTLVYGIGEKIRNEKTTFEIVTPSPLEQSINKIVAGYPIQKMSPYIAQRDRDVAAFMIAIAKKESNWGKYSPKKNGKECYNYWGYRGIENTTRSGYSCFNSSRQAVNVVGSRIEELIAQKIDTPREMVVWKCGRDCSQFSPQSVTKWISDVNFYFQKIYD